MGETGHSRAISGGGSWNRREKEEKREEGVRERERERELGVSLLLLSHPSVDLNPGRSIVEVVEVIVVK